jgi:hypothetical protein
MTTATDTLAKIEALQVESGRVRRDLPMACLIEAIWPAAFHGGQKCRLLVTTRGALGQPRDGAREVLSASLTRDDGERFPLSMDQYKLLTEG